MPYYDSTATYDSGLVYDQITISPPKTMAQIKTDFRDKTPEELVATFTEIINAMTGNAAFPTPNPTLIALTAARDALQTKINDAKAKENAWRAAVAAREAQEETSVGQFTLLASYVQNASNGDEVKILSSGFLVRGTSSSTPLIAPGDLRAEAGDNAGEIDLAWKRVKGASSYEVQCREFSDAAPWAAVKTVTKARLTAPVPAPGKQYAFRVRAIGAQGEGPWSDEAICRAP